MDRKQAEIRAAELRRILWENSEKYYVENAPTMSDFDYDHLMHELEDIEKQYPDLQTPDSPTQKVGSEIAPMLKTRETWSNSRSFFLAEYMPNGIPIITASMKASKTSSRVAGIYCLSSLITGRLLVSDLPRSPWRRSEM
jgi:hypothetical protein